MSEVTFSVTFDNPNENLEATLLPSLMVNILDRYHVDYRDVVVTGESVQATRIPAEFLPCEYDDDPDSVDLWMQS